VGSAHQPEFSDIPEAGAHGFATDGDQGIVHFFGDLVQSGQNFAQVLGELKVFFQFWQVEGNGQNVSVLLGSHDAFFHKGQAFVAHFEEVVAFGGG